MLLSTVASVLTLLIGVFSFSFVFWRKLKEDYRHERIFLLTFFLLVGGVLGYSVSSHWVPTFSYWIGLVLAAITGLYAAKKMEMRVFEVVDAAIISWFWFLLFSSFGLAFEQQFGLFARNLISAFSGILAYPFFLQRYRSFSWYPSGKFGFASIGALAAYFLVQAAASFTLFVMGFSIEVANATISIVIFLLLVATLYLRSGRQLANKINVFWK